MQMIRSGGVDDDLVRWIGRDDRGVALQDPEREAVKRRCVCIRRGVLDVRPGTCAFVAGIPTRRPAAWAAASAATKLGKSVDEVEALYRKHVVTVMARWFPSQKTAALETLAAEVFGS